MIMESFSILGDERNGSSYPTATSLTRYQFVYPKQPGPLDVRKGRML